MRWRTFDQVLILLNGINITDPKPDLLQHGFTRWFEHDWTNWATARHFNDVIWTFGIQVSNQYITNESAKKHYQSKASLVEILDFSTPLPKPNIPHTKWDGQDLFRIINHQDTWKIRTINFPMFFNPAFGKKQENWFPTWWTSQRIWFLNSFHSACPDQLKR